MRLRSLEKHAYPSVIADYMSAIQAIFTKYFDRGCDRLDYRDKHGNDGLGGIS